MPPPEEVCQDLSAAGHALYLPNRVEPPKSWLLLDLPSILHDVYGTLFSQSKDLINEFGLLHCDHLAEFFPDQDLEMVQQLLISLEFCLPVDPLVLKVELSKLTQSKETSKWLFFPALMSAKTPQTPLECLSQQSARYLCWQLRTSKKRSISARLFQTILLRLAAHFVVKLHNEEGVQHLVDILSTVLRLSPKLAAGAYIVHPPKIATSPGIITAPPPKELFPVDGIRSSNRDSFSLSLKDSNTNHSTRAAIFDLFGGCNPTLDDTERISWSQPEPKQSQSPLGASLPAPSQPEPSQTQLPTGPSQPEPNQTQSPPGPSQPEPSQTQLPNRPSQPEPNQTQLPTRPSQPEPSQAQVPSGPSQTQSPLGPSQPEPSQTQLTTRPSQPEPNQANVLSQIVYSECLLSCFSSPHLHFMCICIQFHFNLFPEHHACRSLK